jgi:hypothetical protein
LESYDPYLLLQKNSKNLHAFAIHENIPKTRKAIFWPLKSFRDEQGLGTLELSHPREE